MKRTLEQSALLYKEQRDNTPIKFVHWDTVQKRQGSEFKTLPVPSPVHYVQNYTITVDMGTESYSIDGIKTQHMRWHRQSPLLTIVVRNLNEARKFENVLGKFEGLYVITADDKKVYRLTGYERTTVTLKRIMNGALTKLPWLNPKSNYQKRGGLLGSSLNYA